MSAFVSPIGSNPRLKIAYLVRVLVTRQRLAALDETRIQLPLDDPDRHALDTAADAAFAQMVCKPGATDLCSDGFHTTMCGRCGACAEQVCGACSRCTTDGCPNSCRCTDSGGAA